MSEAKKKEKTYPTSFTTPESIIDKCSCYSLKADNDIIRAKSERSYENWGVGGIPLFYDNKNKKVYMDSSDRHSLILGSTGSKKSRLIAMPIVRLLAKAKESMIVCDPKAEIYQRTAGYLEKEGINIKVINLRQLEKSACWNPLSIPYQYYLEGKFDLSYEYANDIAMNLASMDQFKKDPFWDMSAGSFLFGLILLLFKYCSEKGISSDAVNIGNVFELRNTICQGPNGSDINDELWEYAQKDYFIKSALIGTISTADRTRGGILTTFDQKMRIFSIKPSLLGVLKANDIDYSELYNKPTAIFLILPDEKTAYHRLISLFIKQSYEYIIGNAQSSGFNKVRINYVLDEFSSLPEITDFPAMITAARSRNIRFNLFLQSKHQLRLKYGENCDTILNNCDNWFFLASREVDVLEELSTLCGYIGSEQRKRVLTITDLQRLDKDKGEAIVLSGRNRPMVTELADISEYDDDSILTPKEIDSINRTWEPISFNLSNNPSSVSSTIESLDDLFKDDFDDIHEEKPDDSQSLEERREQELREIQEELERKFDELFGTNSDIVANKAD